MSEHTGEWERLLTEANAGDHEAYDRFLRAVTPVLRGIVRARSGGLGPAAGEDVLQDILLGIHLKRHTWRPDSPVRPWLYAIARYKVIDALRARGQRTTLPIEDFADDLVVADLPDPTLAADMEKMIGMLDARSAEIVRRIGVRGETVGETGDALAMSAGAVRVALHRALRRLASLRESHMQ